LRSGPARAPPRPRTPLQAPQDLLAAALLVRQGAVELAPLEHDLLLAAVQLARRRCVLLAPGAPDVPRAVDRCGAEQQRHLRASEARVCLFWRPSVAISYQVCSRTAARAGVTGASAGDRRPATAAALGSFPLDLLQAAWPQYIGRVSRQCVAAAPQSNVPEWGQSAWQRVSGARLVLRERYQRSAEHKVDPGALHGCNLVH